MKSWKKFLLAVIVSTSVVSTAYADKNWIDSTSGQNPGAEADLLKYFVANKVVSGANLDTNAMANVVYDEALSDGCFNKLSELNSGPFLEAFRTEWKAGFRKKYRLTANSVSWEAFKKIGRDYGGFEFCNQADNQIIIDLVKKRQEVVTVQQQQQALAAQPKTPENVATSDALAAMRVDLEKQIEGQKTLLSTHAGLIVGLRTDVDKLKGDVTTLATDFGAVAARVGLLEGQIDPIKNATEENTRALAGLPDEISAVDKKAMAALGMLIPEGKTPLGARVEVVEKSLEDKVPKNDFWLWGLSIGLIALLAIGLVLLSFWQRHNEEKEAMTLTAKAPAGFAGLGGGKSPSPPAPAPASTTPPVS